MTQVQVIAISDATPEAVLEQQLALLLQAPAREGGFVLRYSFDQYYLPGSPVIELCALVHSRSSSSTTVIEVALLECSQALLDTLVSTDSLDDVAKAFSGAWINLSAPLVLEPVSIPKPWGREIWYTGIEERGQSRVQGQGGSVPLPWLLSLAPQRLAGGLSRQLTLLKILDPLPDEVYGDLYFEMHEEKQEVYVVTHVDPVAWPSGEGGIRFGFDQARRAQFSDDEAFKRAYLAAVKDYEQVRRRIDKLLDDKRRTLGIDLNQPLAAETLQAWQAELPPALLQEERDKRAVMDGYTAIKPLKLGDVVTVPCLTPHSLQHGVRTVEFQTPVYERKILAFAQKVLTQSSWDTDSAMAKVAVEAPQASALEVLQEAPAQRIERVVDFDDFEVHRYRLAAAAEVALPALPVYGLLMVVAGQLQLSQARLEPESAALLPSRFSAAVLRNCSDEGAIFLLALPKI